MTGEVEYLTIEDLVQLATLLVGDPPPIRDVGLLGSAAARPQTTVFGEDAYPDLVAKAAALLQSIVKDHPLVDGNKRLGWLATAVFVELNGTTVAGVPNDDVYNFVVAVAPDGTTSKTWPRDYGNCSQRGDLWPLRSSGRQHRFHRWKAAIAGRSGHSRNS